MNERNYTVYMHINKINDKKYIGITSKKPQMRWKNGYGYERNNHFFSAIQKYDWNKGFEHIILYTNLTKEEAEQIEIQLIKQYKSNQRKYGYNIDNGGSHLGKFSDEHNKKISEAKKGKKFSDKHKQALKEAWKNRPPFTEETKLKMGASRKGSKHPQAKKVICIETGEVFGCTKDAAEHYNISPVTIRRWCRGQVKTNKCLTYHWKYYDEKEVS